MHRFLLRLPVALFESLQQSADSRRVSVNQFITTALEESSAENILTIANTAIDLNRIREIYGSSLEGILLYGSQVRGEAHQDSDIDLLMVLSAQSSIERKLYKQWDEASVFSPKVSPSFAKIPLLKGQNQIGSLWRELALDAKVLWERDLKLSQTLSEIRKQILESSNAERKTAHGHGYWIVKGA
ncbi:nucleotidyltransferase domain-containing protein [bacterium]|nr:nucleotidyltransferase domain-containing protein [bacterium]